MDVSLRRHEAPQDRDEIYVGRYSRFARGLLHLWAYGFKDMIEYECTVPYIKVRACCVNIPCEHFYRPFLSIYMATYVHGIIKGRSQLYGLRAPFCVRVWIEGWIHRGRTHFCTKSQAGKHILPSAKKEDASRCQFECSEPCWAEPSTSELWKLSVWGLLWRQQESQIKTQFTYFLVSIWSLRKKKFRYLSFITDSSGVLLLSKTLHRSSEKSTISPLFTASRKSAQF